MGRGLMIGLLFMVAACSSGLRPSPEKEMISIVCSTGILADAVSRVTGATAEVQSLMGSGVDPHSYRATQGDVQRLRMADLILYNGLHLEGKMQSVLESLGESKPVLAYTDFLDPAAFIPVDEDAQVYDPHCWFDVELWASGLEGLALALGEKFPEHSQVFLDNARNYERELMLLHAELHELFGQIQPDQRLLVTSHDAFSYFGRAYGFEVMSLQGISTVAEFGLKDVSTLVSELSARRTPAVFIESSVSPRSIQSVVEGCRQRGHELVIGGELFSDAMGRAGTPEAQYPGMLLHNAKVISEALISKDTI